MGCINKRRIQSDKTPENNLGETSVTLADNDLLDTTPRTWSVSEELINWTSLTLKKNFCSEKKMSRKNKTKAQTKKKYFQET